MSLGTVEGASPISITRPTTREKELSVTGLPTFFPVVSTGSRQKILVHTDIGETVTDICIASAHKLVATL